MPKQPNISTGPIDNTSTWPCNIKLPLINNPPLPTVNCTVKDSVPNPVASITPCWPIEMVSACTLVAVSAPKFNIIDPPLLTKIPAFNALMSDNFKFNVSFPTTIPLYSTYKEYTLSFSTIDNGVVDCGVIVPVDGPLICTTEVLIENIFLYPAL